MVDELADQPSAEELRVWDSQIVWHAFTQMAEYRPFIVERAEGCTLIDVEGKRYLDAVSSLWCNTHGHQHPRISQAIRDQLDRVAHVTSLGMSNTTSIRLARRLEQVSPPGLQHVFFSSDGSSAVEVALKLAFQYWQQRESPQPQRRKYIAFSNAYHGDTLGSASVGGIARFHELFAPLLFDVVRLPLPSLVHRPRTMTPEQAREEYLRQAAQALGENQGEVAAIIIEPMVHGAAGMITQPPGYLRGLRDLATEHDVFLIADEVAVGFGRTGKLFACEHEQISPDFLCLGKGLTGGYLPMAATLTTHRVWQAFLGDYAEGKVFCHGHTYSGNPLSAAAALATLELFEEEQTLEQLEPKIARLQEHLQRIDSHPHVASCRQLGFLAGIELARDPESDVPYDFAERRGQRVCDHALTEGVWARPLGNVVVIMPPLTIALDELDQICLAIERGIEIATND